MPWKDNIAPLAPEQLQVYRDQGKVHLHWNMPKRASDGDLPRYFVVYRYQASERIDLENPKKIIHIGRETAFTDLATDPKQNYTYAVTSVDRLHNESKTLAAAMLRRTGYTRPGAEADSLRTDNKVYPRYWDNRGQNLRRNTNSKSRFKKSGN